MRAISIIFRRELGAYLRSPAGWVVAALMLLSAGILFQSQVLGIGALMSADALRGFFNFTSVIVGVAAIAISLRLLAEERQSGSIVLLNTSPVRDSEIVLGKFLASFVFLTLMVALTLYMPLLIKINGKISWSHLAVGYLGMLLFGAAALSIGLFASALARHQLVAAVVGAVILVAMGQIYPLAKRLDPPLQDTLSQFDIWWLRFQGSFSNGVINLKDVVYYGAVTYFFLLLSVKTLEAKRWT
jgi:ABC-2 type transport system permease protein